MLIIDPHKNKDLINYIAPTNIIELGQYNRFIDKESLSDKPVIVIRNLVSDPYYCNIIFSEGCPVGVSKNPLPFTLSKEQLNNDGVISLLTGLGIKLILNVKSLVLINTELIEYKLKDWHFKGVFLNEEKK